MQPQYRGLVQAQLKSSSEMHSSQLEQRMKESHRELSAEQARFAGVMDSAVF